MKRLLIAAALATSFPARAEQPSGFNDPRGWEVQEVYVHTVTRHSSNNDRLNDRNWGTGVVLRNGVVLGGYRNSIYQNSKYIAYKHDFNPYVGVIGGLITGYLPQGHALPFAALILTAPIGEHLRVHLNVIPAGRQNIANLSLGYGWRF